MNDDLVMKKKNKNKLLTIIIIVLSIAIISVGGVILYNHFNSNNKEEPKIEEQKEEEPQKEESPIKIIDINSKTRPYAVMINCHNESLPQSGLQDAYIVYEIMVEYGITRMMALFKDVDMAKVGSVRSARNQYLGYVWENDAIYAHAGGSPEALDRIKNEKIADIDVDGKYGVRDKELRKKRAYEHTLFTNSTLLKQGTKDKGLRDTTDNGNLLTYSADSIDLSKYQTQKANKISIKYSSYRTSNYDYDASKKVYLRSMGNKKNTDLVTGKQYEVKNVIAYAVKYTTYKDHGYNGYQKISNIGTGEGYYFTEGVALPITWEKKDEKSKTIYRVKETGEELVVNDGNTYIQIYPSNGGKLSIS